MRPHREATVKPIHRCGTTEPCREPDLLVHGQVKALTARFSQTKLKVKDAILRRNAQDALTDG